MEDKVYLVLKCSLVQISSPLTIEKWFKMARLYTHAPERWPESNSDPEDVENRDCDGIGDKSDEETEVLGTLYAHFYSKNHQKVSNRPQ